MAHLEAQILLIEAESTTYWMALFANRPHSLQEAGGALHFFFFGTKT